MENIAFDSHKRYTLARVEDAAGHLVTQVRIPHERGNIRSFLGGFSDGATVAVETIGNWYWIVDEIEAASKRPALVHALKAKLMMGQTNKTDKLDAAGLNRLQRVGTLPEVWIPPAEVRDNRDLGRTRMVFAAMRTKIKNRIHSSLAKYALNDFEASDIFGKTNRSALEQRIGELPPETRFTTHCLLEELDSIQGKIAAIEAEMKTVFQSTPEIDLLMTMPGVGFLLAVVIANEMGDVERFPASDRFASYSGTTPRVKASGGKVRYGALRSDVNRYLKWAFSEAANSICLNRAHYPHSHVARLYDRVKLRKGHSVAIGAVARHLAEAAFWILKKKEAYKDPQSPASPPRKA